MGKTSPKNRKRRNVFKNEYKAKRSKKISDDDSIDDSLESLDEIQFNSKRSSSRKKQNRLQKASHWNDSDDASDITDVGNFCESCNMEHGKEKYGDKNVDKLQDDESDINLSETKGEYKAKQYVCQALDFGVKSGYLKPDDPSCKVLHVSSDITSFKNNTGRRNKYARSYSSDTEDEADKRQSKSRSRTVECEMKSTRKNRRRNNYDANVIYGGKVYDSDQEDTNDTKNVSFGNEIPNTRSSKPKHENKDSGIKKGKQTSDDNEDVTNDEENDKEC